MGCEDYDPWMCESQDCTECAWRNAEENEE